VTADARCGAGMDEAEIAEVGGELMIGREGRDVLLANMQQLAPEEAHKFLSAFRNRHSLKRRGVAPALELLQMCGVSRRVAHTEILTIVTNELLVLIKEAGDKGEHDRLHALLDSTLTFITVDELRAVTIAVLENVDESIAGTDHWRDIANFGLEKKPYIELPLPLKRRVWDLDSTTFEYEVDKALHGVKDFVSPDDMHLIMAPASEDDACHACFDDAMKRLKILSNNNETRSLGIIVERIVDMARGQEVPENRRISLANLLLSLLARRQNANGHAGTRLAAACQAASLIFRKASEENVSHMDLQALRLLTSWLSGGIEEANCGGENLFEVLALLLHSQRARYSFADQLTLCVEKLAAKKNGVPPSREVLLKDPFVRELATLTMSSIKARQLLVDGHPLLDGDVLPLFDSFLPMFAREIASDAAHGDSGDCADLPAQDFIDSMRRGVFERRVLCTYVYLIKFLGLSIFRYRLVLDNVAGNSNNEGEERELILAHNLIDVSFPEEND
jgi:hypothetical protein